MIVGKKYPCKTDFKLFINNNIKENTNVKYLGVI